MKKGFSLVELIITTTLLGFILLTLFTLFPNSVMAIKHAENRLRAASIAQSVIEIKRVGSFAYLKTDLTAQEIYAVTGGEPYDVKYKWEDITSPVLNPDKIQRITVTVSWTERNGPFSLYKQCDICTVHP